MSKLYRSHDRLLLQLIDTMLISISIDTVKRKIVTMTSWSPDLATDKPRYIAIADAIAADLKSGRLKVGDRLPPQRQLAWQLGVTLGTITRAYQEAERRGLLSGEVGRGSYLRSPEPDIPIIVDSADPAMLDMQVSSPPRVIRQGRIRDRNQGDRRGGELAGAVRLSLDGGAGCSAGGLRAMAEAVWRQCHARPADARSRRASGTRHHVFDPRPKWRPGIDRAPLLPHRTADPAPSRPANAARRGRCARHHPGVARTMGA